MIEFKNIRFAGSASLCDLCAFDSITIRPSNLAVPIYGIRYRSSCFAVKKLHYAADGFDGLDGCGFGIWEGEDFGGEVSGVVDVF